MTDSFKGIHSYGMHQIIAGAEYLYRARPTVPINNVLTTFNKSIDRINALISDLYIGLDSPTDLARDLQICEVALSTYSFAVDRYAPPSQKFLSILLKNVSALTHAVQSQALVVQGRNREAAVCFDQAVTNCCSAILQACTLGAEYREVVMELLPSFSLLKQIQSSDQRTFRLYTRNSIQYLDSGDSSSGQRELHFFVSNKEYTVGIESGFIDELEA